MPQAEIGDGSRASLAHVAEHARPAVGSDRSVLVVGEAEAAGRLVLRVEVRGGGAEYALNQPINQPFIRPTVEAWSGRLIAFG